MNIPRSQSNPRNFKIFSRETQATMDSSFSTCSLTILILHPRTYNIDGRYKCRTCFSSFPTVNDVYFPINESHFSFNPTCANPANWTQPERKSEKFWYFCKYCASQTFLVVQCQSQRATSIPNKSRRSRFVSKLR